MPARQLEPEATPSSDNADPIRIGISACILGEEVRYNGGHKLDRFIRDTLGRFVHFVPVCPEVEIGLGVPRETLRLQQDPDSSATVRLVAPSSGSDHTAAMQRFARMRARQAEKLALCGYILQKGSPSCGVERVRVYNDKEIPRRNGRGLFAGTLIEHLPHLPVEEDGRLNNPRLRENFIERVFAYRRLRNLFSSRWTIADLVRFHTAEKLLLLSHDRTAYQQLGRLVAVAKGADRAAVVVQYTTTFLSGLKRQATPRKHTNVLQHISGFLRRVLEQDERQELAEIIERYHRGMVPLVVPLTLVDHHVRRHRVEYLAQQTYLNPHPIELMLRNHV